MTRLVALRTLLETEQEAKTNHEFVRVARLEHRERVILSILAFVLLIIVFWELIP